MPSYKFSCKVCKTQDDIMFRRLYSLEDRQAIVDGRLFPEDDDWALDTAKNGFKCELCGCSEWASTISSVAKHSTWDSTGTHGVNGYYSKALGKYVDNYAAEKRIMEKKGFVCEADLDKDWWDKKTEEKKAKVAEQDKYINGYKEALASGKSKEDAVAEVFNAKDAVSGHLEKTFKEEKIDLNN